MKILIIALIIVAILAKRHTSDPVTSCIENKCKEEFDACDQDRECLEQVGQCLHAQVKNWKDFEAGIDCLREHEQASKALQCILEGCIGFHGE